MHLLEQILKENRIVKGAKITHLLSSAILGVCGLLILIVFPFDKTVAQIFISGCCMLVGCADIYGYFSNDLYRLAFQSDLAIGAFNIIFGALLISMPDRIAVLMPCTVGLIVILDGTNKLQIAVEGKRFGMRFWAIILALSIAEILAGAAGIVCVYYDVDTLHSMGASMAVSGGVNFWTTMYTVKLRRLTGEFDEKDGKKEQK